MWKSGIAAATAPHLPTMPHNKHPAGSRERRRSSSPDDVIGQMHSLKGGSADAVRQGGSRNVAQGRLRLRQTPHG